MSECHVILENFRFEGGNRSMAGFATAVRVTSTRAARPDAVQQEIRGFYGLGGGPMWPLCR